jgi:hypothetical protein
MKMNVVKDWEKLVSDLKKRLQNGDASCQPLLEKAELDLKKAREKKALQEQNLNGRN